MLTIGSLQLDTPFVQAALSGYSDLPMRRIARKYGASFTLSEVVLDRLVTQKGKTRNRMITVEPDDHPTGAQLMGDNPEEFARAAADMVEADWDVVDINFGCPVKKVVGRCRGGFLLSTPDVALETVRRVVDAVAGRKPVMVKMRKGLDDTPESERNFFEILDGAFEAGIDAVTVHGRTVRQRYVGPSDWSFLTRIKKHIGEKTMLGSGDLFSAEKCIRMIHETGVDGVTIARGAIGNPWIFHECNELWAGRPLPKPPQIPEQGETIREHFEEIVRVHGEAFGSRVMRKFGIRYSAYHPNYKEVRNEFVRVKHSTDFETVLEKWYSPDKDWPEVTRRDHGDLIAAGSIQPE